MSDASAPKVLEIIELLSHQRIIAHLDVLNTTLLIYDVIINLPVEIDHVWRRKWTILSVLYIVQRYLPFFDTALVTLHHNFGMNLSVSYCHLNYQIVGWSFTIGVSLSQIVLTLRVWAIWRMSIPVGVGLTVLFLAIWVPFIPFLNYRGCLITGGSNILFIVFWVFMMVYDGCMLVMMLIPGVTALRRGGRSELVKTIYRDGVVYYALIFWSFTIGVSLSQIVLTLRVWAIWRMSIPVGVGLTVLFLAIWVPFISFLNYRGCLITGGSNILFIVFWVLMMVYDGCMLVMMLIPGVTALRRGGRLELVKTIYRDGRASFEPSSSLHICVVYYALIFLLSGLNVIVILTLPIRTRIALPSGQSCDPSYPGSSFKTLYFPDDVTVTD
ncbi:hypothetical protein L218DRAFT_950532 [Marasmius fiardii PR-910]|nr:hypothetical protein L218DRAFT_950532 [Marasmius fiardii PR-910]